VKSALPIMLQGLSKLLVCVPEWVFLLLAMCLHCYTLYSCHRVNQTEGQLNSS
jgi:hypothetical protein